MAGPQPGRFNWRDVNVRSFFYYRERKNFFGAGCFEEEEEVDKESGVGRTKYNFEKLWAYFQYLSYYGYELTRFRIINILNRIPYNRTFQ